MLSKTRGRITWVDYLLAAGALVSGLYVALTWENDPLRLAEPSVIDTAMGMIMLVVVLEGSRRTVGMSLTVIALAFLAYAYLGPSFRLVTAQGF